MDEALKQKIMYAVIAGGFVFLLWSLPTYLMGFSFMMSYGLGLVLGLVGAGAGFGVATVMNK